MTPNNGFSEHARQAIFAVQDAWIEREHAGDMAGVLELCTDAVTFVPPDGRALRGKEAVAAWLAAQPQCPVPRIEISNVRIDGREGLAYKIADFTTSLNGGDPVRGSHLWVLEEAAPGEWKVAVAAWSIERSQ